ncbi:MAG: DNA modification methylase [Spirochaetes bacterium]|nr:DNA modification methylase [Spirochaetota bacterium]
MKLPIHRWFRYSAGFSSEWVKSVISNNRTNVTKVLDPFAGSGTTLIASNELNVSSVGYEKHPFVRRMANIKLNYEINFEKINKYLYYLSKYKIRTNFIFEEQPVLLQRCYSAEVLQQLVSFRESYIELDDGSPESEIIWLAITAILRITSHVGTAQWQYLLPNKIKKNTLTPIVALQNKIIDIIQDIKSFNTKNILSLGNVIDHDAREINFVHVEAFDLLITSPPYPNNYDYADSTRLEMVFWNEISGWSELQEKVRSKLIRSCSQHSAAEKLKLDDLLAKTEIIPIKQELSSVCRELEIVRHEHGGKKTYHTMIAAYYLDMSKVFISLRKAMKSNSLMCFVIGDSAPYGVYAPADEWLGKLALNAGFESWNFEKTRDRNIKWKNRKHSVPLKEGRLWIRG